MQNKWYLSQKYKKIGGVCSGLALYKNWPVSLVRLAAIGLSFLTGIVFLAYLAAWILVPSSEENPSYDEQNLRGEVFLRERDGAIFAGICAALAKHFDWDVAVIRIIMLVLALAGGGLGLAYIVAWFILPRTEKKPELLDSTY